MKRLLWLLPVAALVVVGCQRQPSKLPLHEEKTCWEEGKGEPVITKDPVIAVRGPTTVVVFQKNSVRAMTEWPLHASGKLVVPVLENVDVNRSWCYVVLPEQTSKEEPDETKYHLRTCQPCSSHCCPVQ